MLVAGFPAGSWATNCYLLAPGPGQECVVVDPGHEAAGAVEEVVRENRLKPVAVLLTHGHLDHTFSVIPVCGAHDVPAYIHPDDRELLTDPGLALSPETRAMVAGLLAGSGVAIGEPDDVRELTDGAFLDLAGLRLTVRHAPGHTRGSVVFSAPADGGDAPVLLSGDLLFKGSVGRSDLPGGDYAELLASLARVVLPLPDNTVVLAGHGPETTVGRERTANPYLAQAAPAAGPARGQ